MTKKLQISHDKFFKQSMNRKEVAYEFFVSNLPEEIKAIADLSSLKAMNTSFIDTSIGVKEADMLFSVNFKDGDTGYFYILLEHQRSNDKLMAFRLLKYMICICDNHIKNTKDKTLPIVYPMVFYTGSKNPKMEMNLWNLFANKELAKKLFIGPYRLVDVKESNDDNVHVRIWCGIMEFVMKHVDEEDIAPFIQKVKPVLKTIGEKSYDYFLEILWYYGNKVESKEGKRVLDIFYEAAPDENREEVMSIFEQLRQEGIALGKQEGIALGEQRGIALGKQEGIALGEQRGIALGEQRGIALGEQRVKLETAKKLLSAGMTIKMVSEITELPESQISALLH